MRQVQVRFSCALQLKDSLFAWDIVIACNCVHRASGKHLREVQVRSMAVAGRLSTINTIALHHTFCMLAFKWLFVLFKWLRIVRAGSP